jgi:hypothetical protein
MDPGTTLVMDISVWRGYTCPMARDISEKPTDEITILGATNDFATMGYTTQFAPIEGGVVRCFDCRSDTVASAFTIDALERSEGASDPADMVANVAARCPSCGAKGVLTLKFGPEASIEEAEVFSIIEDNRDVRSGGTSV